MKLLYKPFGIIFGVLGGLIGGMIFKQIWKLAAGEEDAPQAKEREHSWGEVLPAAALQGAIFALVKAAIDRGGAQGFEKLTGVWPGD
jgi:predicted metal-dependent enzyme (double-stranded beta helix superfamily)